ncbi:MAG: Lysylphosphatidylglycerol synthase region [Pseudomonadota bacterium]|jgi:hypothetical protein
MLAPQPSVIAKSVHWYQRRWLRLVISLALLASLLSVVDFSSSRWLESARQVIWWPIVVALLLRPLAVLTNAWHTSLLLDSAGAGLSLREVWSASMFGEMLSRFVPGNLGTIAYVTQLSPRAGDALIAQVLDRVLFLVVILLAAALSLALADHPLLGLLALGALVAVVLLAVLFYKGVVHWAPLGPAPRDAIERMLQRRSHWGRPYGFACVLSIALMTLLFWLLVVACGGSIDVFESLAAVTLVTIGAALPFSINGIGIREWVFVALLRDNFASKEALVTLAAMTYLVGFASALAGVGTWALLRQKSRPIDAGG